MGGIERPSWVLSWLSDWHTVVAKWNRTRFTKKLAPNFTIVKAPSSKRAAAVPFYRYTVHLKKEEVMLDFI